MSDVGLSAMGSTFAERKAFREAAEAKSAEEAELDVKAVQPEGAENKSVASKRTAKK